MNKRYELGVLDTYPIAVMETAVEDSPTLGVVLDADVDHDKLFNALNKALKMFPLFKTKIVFDKGYYLEENNNPLIIFNEDDYHKTFTWKKGTNEYLFKISYFKNRILLRWCHAISDGKGAEDFLKALLNIYYDVSCNVIPALELGLEPFADKKEKGIKQKKQLKGFETKGLEIDKTNTFTNCHVLKCKTKDVLALAKRSDASPATIFPPIFSMALRNRMKKKKNVKVGIVVDARKQLEHNTMHNCIFTKEITYIDKYDSMDFELVSTIYRSILLLALEKENVIKKATESVNLIKILTKRKHQSTIKFLSKLFSILLKSSSLDVGFTYLGKVDYGEEVNKHLKDYIFMSWPDFGYCNIALVDFKDEFTLRICDKYKDEHIIEEFINVASKLGLQIEEVESFKYYKEENRT